MAKKLFHGFEVLTPNQDPIIVDGNLRYHESTRSNSLLLIKRPIRSRFIDLGEKSSLIAYRMEYYHSMKELKERIDTLEPQMLPFLMFLMKKE